MSDETTRLAARTFIALSCQTVVALAAIRHFGLLDGIGIAAAIWLLMPYARSK